MNTSTQLQNVIPPTPIGGIIPLDQAIAETTRWRAHQLEHFAGNAEPIKAFYIPMWDLQCLLDYYNMYKPTGVRAYIGMRDTTTPGCSSLRLLLVPATIDEDIWNAGTVPSGGAIGSSIYDFTAPCPDTCSSTNPLNPD